MPYYGVQVGREGPKIYFTWTETKTAVEGFSGSKHKKFTTLEAAEHYVAQAPSKKSMFNYRPYFNPPY